MTPDYEAPEVTVGSNWYVWERHQRVVERWEQTVNEEGAPSRIPYVRLQPLNTDGTLAKGRKGMPVAAWRVAYYGIPSLAFN